MQRKLLVLLAFVGSVIYDVDEEDSCTFAAVSGVEVESIR